MSLANIRSNIVGTVSPTFGIGKGGPLIRQGTSDPNAVELSGANGDLYIKTGTTPRFYQRRGLTWIELTPDSLVRTVVSSNTYAISNDDYYIAVRHSGVALTLPTEPATGKRIIIKDELGGASPTSPIVISTTDSSTIDGKAELSVASPYAAVSLVWGSDGWFLTSDATTDSFRQNFIFDDLVNGVLTVTHNLNEDFPFTQIYSDEKVLILPDAVRSISENVTQFDFSSYVDLFSGTWTVIIRK